jgi:hypothetical protein
MPPSVFMPFFANESVVYRKITKDAKATKAEELDI